MPSAVRLISTARSAFVDGACADSTTGGPANPRRTPHLVLCDAAVRQVLRSPLRMHHKGSLGSFDIPFAGHQPAAQRLSRHMVRAGRAGYGAGAANFLLRVSAKGTRRSQERLTLSSSPSSPLCLSLASTSGGSWERRRCRIAASSSLSGT